MYAFHLLRSTRSDNGIHSITQGIYNFFWIYLDV